MGTHFKTKLLLISSFLIILISTSVFIYIGLMTYSYADFFRLLKLRAITAAQIQLSREDSPDINSADPFSDYRVAFPNEKDYFYKITDTTNYGAIAEKLNVPADFFRELLQNGESDYRSSELFYKGIRYQGINNEYAVVVTAENYYVTHHLHYLRRILIAATVIALIFAVGISTYLSRTIFRPLKEITDKVNEISSENLHLRLPPRKGRNTELNSLIGTFNNMLDRIETAFETQNNFISNASHELRTPLTAIIGEADVTLSKERSVEDYVETIKVMLQEAEKLDQKTQALLFLAQTGFNEKVQKFAIVRIDQLIWDVQETLQKINNKIQIKVDLSSLPDNPYLLKVRGSEQLLHLALSNIITNASKYSDNKTVQLSLRALNNLVVIIIRDQGIGIPSTEIKYIYDPFFRASNTKRYEGYGIGLPLTRNIIRMHKGELIVSSIENRGTTVQISLPVADLSAETAP